MEFFYFICRFSLLAVFLFSIRGIFKKILWCSGNVKFAGAKRGFFGLVIIFFMLFTILFAGQARWYFSGSSGNLPKSREIYDKRFHYRSIHIHKGNIYDRTGTENRRLAFDEKNTEKNLYNRIYPLSGASVHLLGYHHILKGNTGIEKVFYDILSGSRAGSLWRWDDVILNRYYRFEPVGWDVYLTINSAVQKTAYEAFKGRRGAAVVMNPQNGELLAVVSSPSFDPAKIESRNDWLELIKDTLNAPLFNRAFYGRYPPGSTFKIITAAAAIDEGITPVYKLNGKGYRPPDSDRPVYDHELESYRKKGLIWKGHGKTGLKKAIIKSSNEYFAKLANELGNKKLQETAERFGFNQRKKWNTSSEKLEREFGYFTGTFPRLKENDFDNGAWCALGQGRTLASPLQMARVVSVIANGGQLVDPLLELGRYGPGNNQVIPQATAIKIQGYLLKAVSGGTGRHANIKGMKVAGKTGTAEVNYGNPHSWFVSFAPFNNAKIAIAVVVENGGWGSVAAAEIAKKILLKAKKEKIF